MIRKVLFWLAVVVVVLWVVHNPGGAAVMARHLGAGLSSTANGLGAFFTGLTGGK